MAAAVCAQRWAIGDNGIRASSLPNYLRLILPRARTTASLRVLWDFLGLVYLCLLFLPFCNILHFYFVCAFLLCHTRFLQHFHWQHACLHKSLFIPIIFSITILHHEDTCCLIPFHVFPSQPFVSRLPSSYVVCLLSPVLTTFRFFLFVCFCGSLPLCPCALPLPALPTCSSGPLCVCHAIFPV